MRPWLVIVVGVLCLLGSPVAQGQLAPSAAQDERLADRPVSAIDLQGLGRVTEQQVFNNIRSRVGQPYDPDTARADVNRLTRLGDFRSIDVVAVLNDDGTVSLRYLFAEEELLSEVSVVGNRMLSDSALLGPVGLHRGSPRDEFLIQRGVRLMETIYQTKGFYLVEVRIDERTLAEDGVLIYEVIEGPRVRICSIEFVGNRAFDDKKLRSQIETTTWFPLFSRAALDEDQLVKDVRALGAFYADRGWIDVRVDRSIEISPDQREAKVVFLVEEGQQYRVSGISVAGMYGEPTEVLSERQVRSLMTLQVGDAWRADLLRRSEQAIRDAYGVLGYLDTQVIATPFRRGDSTELDLHVEISEGRIADVGLVSITGNTLTQDRVIRGLTGLKPGHRFDAREIARTEERIQQSGLFSHAKVRVLDPRPDSPDERDVLIEVKERNTGSLNFGVGVGSDSGVLGTISLTQNNFDVADVPQTFGEFFAGRAFRGAGQRFLMSVQPGDEIFTYNISLTEPHFLDSDWSLGGNAGYLRRIYQEYTEERLATGVVVSRQLGDVWFGDLRVDFKDISLLDLPADTPDQITDDQGPDRLHTIGGSLVRTTFNSMRRPTRGSRISLSYANTGLLGGDLEFSRAGIDFTSYLLVDRDFMDRPTTLRFDAKYHQIFGGEAPSYEKLYLGGRSFRGFNYRAISPKGTLAGAPTDVSVGGDLMMFVGAQYQMPLVGNTLDAVFFVDSGTVNDDSGLSPYRVSVGAGVRVYIAALGSTPLAFDFGFPVLKEDTDETQLFSFSADLPF
ncbi:MAG: outer membrane protein assembly factor BamA [Phycisphaerales bacterium]|nr:outer membrane protein assembly factor BamA [Phycisphaerales bacterium]